MNDFDYDVMQKKRVASGARYRKCGSKSRKCSLTTDYMTPKQWRERCGNVVSVKLAEPMTWNEYKGLSPDIQKEYVDGLMEKFHPTASDLGRVFGVTSQTVVRYLNQLGYSFSPGKKMPKECIEAFRSFMDKNNPVVINESVEDTSKEENTPTEISVVKVPCVTMRDDGLKMTDFSLTFSGKYTPDMIHNSIAAMLPEGTQVQIEIRCRIAPAF